MYCMVYYMSLQPAQPSQTVLKHGPAAARVEDQYQGRKKFPIPNEKAMRMAKSNTQKHTYSQATRKIPIRQPLTAPSNPIHPPNLQECGSRIITTRQLLRQRDNMVSKTRSGTKYHEK